MLLRVIGQHSTSVTSLVCSLNSPETPGYGKPVQKTSEPGSVWREKPGKGVSIMDGPIDFKVDNIVITLKGNLIIGYSETVNGVSIGRLVMPEFINCPPTPPVDLGSIWD